MKISGEGIGPGKAAKVGALLGTGYSSHLAGTVIRVCVVRRKKPSAGLLILSTDVI